MTTAPHQPQPTHTTTIRTDFAPTEVIVRGGDGRWHQVLNDLWDADIVSGLPDRDWRVLGAFLRLRDARQPDHTHAPLGVLMRLTGRSRSYVYDGTNQLLGHAAGLLARVGSEVYHVLPGWPFAGRNRQSATVDDPVHNGGQKSTTADSRIGNVRAHQTTQRKTEISGFEPAPESDRADRIQHAPELAGWLAAAAPLMAPHMPDADPRRLLMLLNLREPTLKPTAALEGLTAAEVWRTAQDVAADPTVRIPRVRPVILADRLFRARGLERPTGLRSAETERRRDAQVQAARLAALGDGWSSLARTRGERGGMSR